MVKIIKNQYGHRVNCFDKDVNGNNINYYINVDYKKGLNVPDGDYEGELILKTADGVDHKCFFSCYKKKDGTVEPKLVIIS